MKKYILSTCAFLLPIFAYAQTEVLMGLGQGKDYGVTYTLPKTELNIEVKAQRITYTPGEFSRYAEHYLRLGNVSVTPEEYWELTTVTAESKGIPDNENTYFIKLKDKTVAPLVELTPEGLLKSINASYGKEPKPETGQQKPEKKRQDPKDFLTEEILMASSTAKMAELTSKEIYSIRESRNALLRGHADNMPKDAEQMKLMLEHMEAQESAMLELFTGVRRVEEKVILIKLTPDREIEGEVAFRFSRKLGVLGKDDLAGAPVYLSLENLKTVDVPEGNAGKKKIAGVAYNVPGRARVTIVYGKEQLFRGDLPVTQFGVVEYLAATLFNKNSSVKVIFNPETGGLVKIDRE